MTAKAAYPGSVTWLISRMSASIASSLVLSLKGSGALRYGGRGLPLVTEAERRDNIVVSSWDVTFTDLTRRAKVFNQDA